MATMTPKVAKHESGWARRPRWTERAGFALALCLPATAGAALVMHAVRAAEVPSQADWRAAAASVRAGWQTGDIVTFLPGWAQEGRGEFAGLRAVPETKWDEESVSSAKRVVVVASFDEALPSWLEQPPSAGPSERSPSERSPSERFGKLRVYRVSRTATEPVFDFTSQLADAQVSLEWGGRPAEACAKDGPRHDCTQRNRLPWRYVAEHRMTSGGRTRRCLWAHPTTGAGLRIHFPAATLGKRLRLGHGLSDGVAGGAGAPVTVQVQVGNETIATITQPPSAGWLHADISTAAHAGRNKPVSFVISTPDDGSRHFCFAAEALP